jgi:DNA ligase-1
MATEASKPVVLHKEYLPIFGTDKLGKTRIWQATIFILHGEIAQSVIQHGVYGGKLQLDSREYTEGKNKGKKNETTALEQCVAETEKKRRDKIEKEGYREMLIPSTIQGREGDSREEPRKIFPMLANKYDPATASKKRSGIQFPCFVQPKLDGLRCVAYLANGSVMYQSRTGGIFTALEHLDGFVKPLLEASPNLVFDGELYTTKIPFEELVGVVKKKTISSEEDRRKIQCVQYHVYDLVIPDAPFRERLERLQTIVSNTNTGVIPVSTYIVNSPAEFKEKFGEFVAQGYEGIMLRNTEGKYQENYRSNDLVKYKEFFEAEYPIVDFKEAAGRDAGTVIWECETPEGRRFSVRPRGTLEMRKRWFESAKSLVGRQLTVIYQELSEMGVPRFPVGKAIRDGY